MIDRALLRGAMDLHREGRLDEARRVYETLALDNPDDPDILHMLGILAGQRGDLNQSAELIRRALRHLPASPVLYKNLAVTLERLGNLPQASMAFCMQGNLLLKEKRPDEALAVYHAAQRVDPANTHAIDGLVTALNRTGRNEEARRLAEEGLARHEALPADAIARLQLGLGNALHALGNSEGALAAYDASLRHNPLSADAHVDRAVALLDLGQYEEGWKAYEWRWKQAGYIGLHGYAGPVWNGEPPEALNGKLFVLNEQGFGDSIQFSRYIPLLAARGYDVLLDVRPELYDLFAHSFRHPRIAFIKTPPGVPAVYENLSFASMAGLISLPRLLGPKPEDCPAGAYLKADPARIAQWQTHISGSGLKVGLAWQGNPAFQYDFRRSMPPRYLQPLLARSNVSFYALHRDRVADFPENVTDLSGRLNDFADTAAVISCLDLVISTDTAVPHLAAALGRPTWIMVSKAPDWRWGRAGEACPWYQTVRLFRQPVEGDWESVIAAVGASLDPLR